MAAPDSPAPADDYQPAVFADKEKVDSEKGKPWHLVAQDEETRKQVYAGKIVPMTADAFAKKQADSKPE